MLFSLRYMIGVLVMGVLNRNGTLTSFLLGTGFCLFVTSSCLGQSAIPVPPKLADEFDVELNVSANFAERSAGFETYFYSAKVKSEAIWAGKKVKFQFQFTNSGSRDFEFDSVSTSCGCFAFSSDRKIVPAGGKEFITAVGMFRAPPAMNSRIEYELHIKFILNDRDVGILVLTGDLAGVLSVPNPRPFEIEGEFAEVSIPFLFTPLENWEMLELKLSNSLRDVSGRIAIVEEKPMIVLAIPSSALGPSGIMGELTVQAEKMGLSAGARVVFSRRPKVRVSPIIVSFELAEGEGQQSYVAQVLIQATNLRDKNPSKSEEQNRLHSVACVSDDFNPKLKVDKINDQLFRVEISINPDETEAIRRKGKEVNFEWNIVTSEAVFKLNGSGYLNE